MADTAVFEIDTDLCAGHGRCYAVAPESFEADDNGYGVVLGRDERERSADDIADIIASCPEEAISIRTDGSTS